MPFATQAAATSMSLFKKVIYWSTGIILVISLMQATILSVKEKSIRPLIVDFASRFVASDNYLFLQYKDLKSNPDQLYYDAKYQKAQSTFKSDPNRLQLEMNELNTKWSKFKFQVHRVWIWFDLILSIFMIITFFMLLYYLVDFIGSFSPMGNVVLAFILLSLLQVSASLVFYQAEDHANKNFMELDLKMQGLLLNPYKGVWSIAKDFPYIIGKSFNTLVVPVQNAQDSNNPIISTVGRVLG